MTAATGPFTGGEAPETTHDTVYGGRVHLVQPRRGFRANSDSLLLASALGVAHGGEALELGCGCGGALFPAAFRRDDVQFTGLELVPDIAQMAQAGADLNGFGDRVSVETGNGAEWVRGHENRFDAVFSNPPYFVPGTISDPAEGRQTAYIETMPLEDWLKAMVFAAKPRAPITVIHRAAELARLLDGFNRWTGEVTVLPIHPAPGDDANRVLVRGRKGLKRGAVRVRAGLILQGPDGRPSDIAEAIKCGEALTW